jgi:ribosomal protein S1
MKGRKKSMMKKEAMASFCSGDRVRGKICKVFKQCFYVEIEGLDTDCLVQKSWIGAIDKDSEFLKVRIGSYVSGILGESSKGLKLTQVIVLN